MMIKRIMLFLMVAVLGLTCLCCHVIAQEVPKEPNASGQTADDGSNGNGVDGEDEGEGEGEGETEFLEAPDDDEDVQIDGAEASVSDSDGALINIKLDDVEMVDVVKMFTHITQANIIATPSNLQGRVTVNLQNVQWQPALVSILDMHNLELVEKTPGTAVYSIVPKRPGVPPPLKVETVFLSYASVSNVEKVVKSMLDSRGTVSTFSSRNALVIRATEHNLMEIRQIIDKIDKLRDQVFIEAKFMELNDEAIKDLGINWQVLQAYNVSAGTLNWGLQEERAWKDGRTDKLTETDQRDQADSIARKFDSNGRLLAPPTIKVIEERPDSTEERPRWNDYEETDPTREITDGITRDKDLSTELQDAFTKTITDVRTAVLGIDDFRVVMSAFKEMSGVTIVSNPKIVVANEEPAIIHIGQTERPFISSVTPGQQGIAPVITYNPGDPVDFGVKLTVTPTVNTASNITVKIEPELTRLLRDAVAPNGQTYPVIAKKKIRTVFCLESGKTVAIGGLTETKDRDITSKIPLLGDIPIIGKYLFSHTHKETSQQETIIFVTVGMAVPESIQEETGLPDDTELTQRHLLRKKAKKRAFQAEYEKAKALTEAAQLELVPEETPSEEPVADLSPAEAAAPEAETPAEAADPEVPTQDKEPLPEIPTPDEEPPPETTTSDDAPPEGLPAPDEAPPPEAVPPEEAPPAKAAAPAQPKPEAEQPIEAPEAEQPITE